MKEKLVETILPLITVTAVILISVMVGSNIANRDSPISSPSPIQEVMQPVESFTANTGDKTPSGSISIPGFDRVTMKAKQLNQDITLYNPQQNDCYFQISIMLSEGVEIYRSGLLKPGQTLTSIKLSRTLEKGTYDGAILRYSCFTMDDLQPLNGADTKFTLEVE
jgi:hypothetical protein